MSILFTGVLRLSIAGHGDPLAAPRPGARPGHEGLGPTGRQGRPGTAPGAEGPHVTAAAAQVVRSGTQGGKGKSTPSRPSQALRREPCTRGAPAQRSLRGHPRLRRDDVHGVGRGIHSATPLQGLGALRRLTRAGGARCYPRDRARSTTERAGASGALRGGDRGADYLPNTASRVCARLERWSFMRSSRARRIDASMSSALRMIWGVMKTSSVDIASCLVRFLNR